MRRRITEEQQEKIRGIALQALRKYRDEGHKLPPAPVAHVHEMVNFVSAHRRQLTTKSF